MEISDFPDCCGISVLHELSLTGGYSDGVRWKDWDKKGIVERLRILLEDCKDAGGKGLVLASTITEQNRIVPYLKGFGFKASKRFINPNTCNRVVLWELNLNRTSLRRIYTRASKLLKNKNLKD